MERIRGLRTACRRHTRVLRSADPGLLGTMASKQRAAVRRQRQAEQELQLSKPLIKAVGQLGFTRPTPIQAAVIPHAIKGLDLCASAVTGSGKTAAFMLPILERLLYRPRRIAATRVLVLP